MLLIIIKIIYFLFNLYCLLLSFFPLYKMRSGKFVDNYIEPFFAKYITPNFGKFGLILGTIIWMIFNLIISLLLFTFVAYQLGFPPDVGDFWSLLYIPSLVNEFGYLLFEDYWYQ